MTAPRPNDAELDALLGAYVLDALDADERDVVAAYVESNDRARAEVDELRETASVLANTTISEGRAPVAIWERIAADLQVDELQARRQGESVAGRTASRRTQWIASTVAVAAAGMAVVLGAQVVSLNDRLDNARGDVEVARGENVGNLQAAFDRAVDTEGAREAAFVLSGSDQALGRVVVLPDGTGYMVNDEMEPLSEDQTYQLWALVGDGTDRRVISAGILGADPKAVGFRVDGPVEGFAVTVEQAGGVEKTEHGPVVTANLA